jgi:hypothetical protein
MKVSLIKNTNFTAFTNAKIYVIPTQVIEKELYSFKTEK